MNTSDSKETSPTTINGSGHVDFHAASSERNTSSDSLAASDTANGDWQIGNAKDFDHQSSVLLQPSTFLPDLW
jgi:hypothetical protein